MTLFMILLRRRDQASMVWAHMLIGIRIYAKNCGFCAALWSAEAFSQQIVNTLFESGAYDLTHFGLNKLSTRTNHYF
jgi:hypothetical protein